MSKEADCLILRFRCLDKEQRRSSRVVMVLSRGLFGESFLKSTCSVISCAMIMVSLNITIPYVIQLSLE